VADRSSIEWTDATWNPTRGCDKVSAGCKHCYAETFAERWRGVPGHAYERGFDLRPVPEQLALPLRWRKPKRIFVNSMSDLFHEDVPDEYIAAVFGVMAACPQHTFQVLTKRAERLPRWFAWVGEHGGAQKFIRANADKVRSLIDAGGVRTEVIRGRTVRSMGDAWMSVFNAAGVSAWPLPNVWLGVSTENQEAADERIPHLLATPATVRFVSAEPLLGPVRLDEITLPDDLAAAARLSRAQINALTDQDDEHVYNVHAKLDWVIVGGESGPGARPFDIAWGRSIVEQCRAAGVPVFCKQLGANPTESYRDARNHGPMIRLKSRKGGDPNEWPEDLRVRQFPGEPTQPVNPATVLTNG
jgi:protein gp37